MDRTRERASQLIKNSKIKEAIKIVRTFDALYSKEELRVLQIAHECNTGYAPFYTQLGIDIRQVKERAEELLKKAILK